MATATELAHEYYEVLREIHDLNYRKLDLEDRLGAEMVEDVIETEHGPFQRRYGKTRKEWDHEGLRKEVIAHTVREVDPNTGEIESDAEAQIRTVFQVAHVDYWRVTQLRQMGIAADEFCAAIPGRVTVQFLGKFDDGEDL